MLVTSVYLSESNCNETIKGSEHEQLRFLRDHRVGQFNPSFFSIGATYSYHLLFCALKSIHFSQFVDAKAGNFMR